MGKKLRFLFCLFLLPHWINAQVRLFYLGGQSNMSGFGKNADLPKELNKPLKNVWIFDGNTAADDEVKGGGQGIWETVRPGHGYGFTSDGITNKLSPLFGPELSFAKKMQELYPNEKIAIIKYTRSGSAIDSLGKGKFGCWEPDYKGTTGINQYDHFLATVKNALKTKDIDGDGKDDQLIPTGIVWMQGESDGAYTEAIALRYYDNLKRMMELIRACFKEDDLPVVLGKISDSGVDKDGKLWDYGDLVQYAQEKFVKTDVKAALVRSTKDYGYSDPYHYNSAGFIDLGEKFAETMYGLVEGKSVKK